MFTNNQRQEERTGKYGTPRLQYLQELVNQFQNAEDEGTFKFCSCLSKYRNLGGSRGRSSFSLLFFLAVVQVASMSERKERIVANLANFAYDPYNYTFLRQLNVLELFLDCITEPNEKLVEFGIGGICNSCVDPANAAIISQSGGIPLTIQCLSSPVRNTVRGKACDSLLLHHPPPHPCFITCLAHPGDDMVNYALGSLYYLCNSLTKEEILKPEVIEVIKRYAAAETVNVSFSNLAKAFLDKHVYENK
ncbi:hypothetical protein SADUNF_Sadunf16G0119800 [Salix dunnii]|uniref:Armadillo repeat-containing protein 7 n=1 Tax=Salix dunnii TaxID=1413687 RepID=A0A835J9R5_9ROSI|nr:hypothetical protein SADUNF_Sadunf16G0119800 [Salix dunnii]